MATLARSLGVPESSIVLESTSANTEDQARFIRVIVGPDPFYLVTSAFHMQRAQGLMLQQGLHPLPAPSDHQAPGPWAATEERLGPADWLPNAHWLHLSEVAAYEWLAVTWSELRGQANGVATMVVTGAVNGAPPGSDNDPAMSATPGSH